MSDSGPNPSTPPAIIALTKQGGQLASALKSTLVGAEVHGLTGRVSEADQWFDDTLPHIQALFAAGHPLVGICSTGILVRALGPVLTGKHSDPPVLAVSEDGQHVVPLLGGHHGANDLAKRIAAHLGGNAAITTASNARFNVQLDEPPAGWRLGNADNHKPFMAALLNGERCRLEGDAPWIDASDLPLTDDGPLRLLVTHEQVAGDDQTLVIHPARLTVGVGCERDTEPAELVQLVRETLASAGLAPEAVGGVFSLDLKADEPAVHTAAADLGVPARFFSAAALEAEAGRLANPSDLVFKEVGCHGVAEGAALAAAGPAGEFCVTKRKSRRATCAVAIAPAPLNGESAGGLPGTPRGRLTVVGLGPGANELRTPQSVAALREARHIVGYHLYLELAGGFAPWQAVHGYGLGEETERVDEAIRLAARGEDVALVCSGDPGVYAMASLVFERLDLAHDAKARRSEVRVLPGVSAMFAAAAQAGAPLGHDFCAISLSDLLTPWEAIESRLAAAAAGDFVVALYNPASQRRRRQLKSAVEVLERARGSQAPVVIARQVGRPEQSITHTTLGELDQDSVDMMTVLLVGSSQSRQLTIGGATRVYTPRGYRAKNESNELGAAE